MKFHRFSLLRAFLFLIFISRSLVFSKDFLGIAPEDEKYFMSDRFKCKDGSKTFANDRLNDDFCDCADGTDEPGTSACPEGRFYCRNKGHLPLIVFSSRVNDGICDCCDGSDEHGGGVKCPNTCWEAGKEARDKLKKKISMHQDGVILRRQDVEKAKAAIVKEEAELHKLRDQENALKELVKKLREHKEQIEKAEEQERLEKEKEAERLREDEKNANEQGKQSDQAVYEETKELLDEEVESSSQDAAEDIIGTVEDAGTEASSDHVQQHTTKDIIGTVEDEKDEVDGTEVSPNHAAQQDIIGTVEDDEDDGSESDHAVQQEQEKSASTEGLSREELGRLVASRWTGENAGHAKDLDDTEHKANQDVPDNEHDDEYSGYPSESEDESRQYDDSDDDDDDDNDGGMEDESMDDDDEYHKHEDYDSKTSFSPDPEDKTDFSDLPTQGSTSWLDKIKQTFQSVLRAVKLFKTPVDKSEAARVKKEYDDYNSKLSKIQSRISSLTEKLKQDFGTEKEFYSFYDRCFENKQNKYVYKVCPFKQASQVEGYSTTQLGRWEKFDDSYRTMQFSNGDKCWNGPDRSLKVKLRCGLRNELADVDEPSRCEYVALLSTPAACVEERLKELQRKLDSMNADQMQGHDEL